MRKVPFIVAGVVAMTTAYAEAAPPTKEPQVAIQAPDSPRAPQAIAVISCQVDDMGFDTLPDNVLPSREWRNLDWHRDKGGNLICKRELVEIEDKDEIVNNSVQLHHNFGEPGQCVRGAALFFTTSGWDAKRPKWAVIAVGCPTPITDPDGKIVGWHMPECPSHVPGNDEMPLRCKFDESGV